jgi:predicted DNA-binding protein
MKAAKESSPAVQLPVVLHKRLKVYCKKNGLMIKDFVRNAIEQHLAVDVAFRKR